jgi:hypothetical protein
MALPVVAPPTRHQLRQAIAKSKSVIGQLIGGPADDTTSGSSIDKTSAQAGFCKIKKQESASQAEV